MVVRQKLSGEKAVVDYVVCNTVVVYEQIKV